MRLTAGTRVGAYEVVALLGAGGMGEVYRARDTKLGRDVALKILPDRVTHDSERIARFRREAQILAALNHPHIAAIYGLDEANGCQFLVLELIEGETLAERLRRGPVPVDEAVALGREMADALEAAHDSGIVHRDLKPANIALTRDGHLKVLDFGLAKATAAVTGASPDPANSPTLTSPVVATGAGVILGTAAYMSPEQAKGRGADKRSDMWAFGCVLYEALTGIPAFAAEDVSETLANVLKAEPDWTAIPAGVPEQVQLMLRRCLERDRSRRISDAGTARFLMTEAVAVPATAAIRPRPRPHWARAAWTGIAAALGAAVAGVVVWSATRPRPAPIVRFSVALPEGQQLAGRSQVIAISPDGLRIVYAAGTGDVSDSPRQATQLYMRSVGELDAHPIQGTSLDVMSPAFSPDGKWLVFYSFQDSTLKKIAVSGGAPVTICKADPPYGVVWDGDRVVYADQGSKGILRVSSNGGEPEVLAPVKPGEIFSAPQMLDEGKTLLFTVTSAQGGDRWDRAQIVAQTVGSTERRVIVRSGSEGHYVPSGHLVYMVGSTLLAVPVQRRTLQVLGGPIAILEDVRRFRANIGAPGASFAFSSTGTLVYITGPSGNVGSRIVALASRSGKLQPLGLPAEPYLYPRVSPDGSQLAVQTDDGNESIIWVYDLKHGGPPRRLTFGGRNSYPAWTPDGRRITFQSDRDGDHGVFWQPADGTGPAERLFKPESRASQDRPEAWSPDGRMLTFSETPPFDSRLFAFSIGAAPARRPLWPDVAAQHSAFSPDGRWIAYASTEIGNRPEVFVQPFPPTGAKYQISTEGGRTPLWSMDGAALYYWANLNQRLVAVDVRTRPTFGVGARVALPVDAIFTTGAFGERNYDATPAGELVVVSWPDSASRDPRRASPEQIDVVLNWMEELKADVPTK